MAEIVPLNDAAKAWLEDVAADAEAHHAVVPAAGPAEPIRRLVEHLDQHGRVPNRMVAAVAAELGLSIRQVRRRLAAARGTHPSMRNQGRRWELNDDCMQVLFAHCGNVAAAHRDLVRAGKAVPDLSTFRRRWLEQPAHIRAFARDGASGARAMWLYTRYEAPARNAIWYADHFELPVDVVADGRRTATMKPWLTLFEDDRSRRIMAWAITANPGRRVGADVVVACLADAIRTRVVGGVTVGGVPERVLWDNAPEFLSGEVTQFALQVGFEAVAVRPYSGHLKGKVERLGQTVQDDFCTTLNGYTHGPDTYTRTQPFRLSEPMTAALLRARFEVWVDEYNQARPHSSLGGATPHEVWAADTAPLRLVDDARLRSGLLIAPRLHKVQNTGVHFRGQYWLGAGLADHVNRSVQVRYPVDPTSEFIELYYDGAWLCTAHPAAALSEDDRRRLLDTRRDQYELARELQRAAKRRREQAEQAATTTLAAKGIVAATRSADPYQGSVDDLFDLTGTDGEIELPQAVNDTPAPATPKKRSRSKKQDS